MSDWRYRYTTVRGVERNLYYRDDWQPVTGAILETMTADELRAVADAMDGAKKDSADVDEWIEEDGE